MDVSKPYICKLDFQDQKINIVKVGFTKSQNIKTKAQISNFHTF